MTSLPKLAARPPALVGGLVGLVLLAATAVPLFAQSADEMAGRAPMEQMVASMHGESGSPPMQEMMGDDSQAMMDQCMAMMSTMMEMPGMGGQDGQPMQEMMPGMMGQ